MAEKTKLLGCGKETKTDSEEHHCEHRSYEAAASIVHLNKHKVFHAGIRVEPVQKKSVAVPLNLPGKVGFNERRLAHITARFNGRVEKLYAFTSLN